MNRAAAVALISAFWFSCIFFGEVCAQDRRAGTAASEPLKMEELEIRGLLEKPDRLYLPVPGQIPLPLPTRFDFFQEDLARPITPREITNDGIPYGGASESGETLD